MATPAAGLVKMQVLVCLGAVLICLACVSTRLPWVLDKTTASVEKEFGPSAVYNELELKLIQSNITQKPVLRGEVGACRFTQLTSTAKRYAVYGKSNRAADLLCKHFYALDHSSVEEGEVTRC